MGGVLGEKSFEEGFEAVKDWVVANGGMVKATVKTNENGVRGLYTTEAIKKSERIAVITAASILNAGSSENHFTTTMLRELKDPHSRFRSAMDMLPKPHEVLNACNFPDEYLPLMTEWMVSQIKSRQSHFEPMLDGSARSTMEFTIPEVMGTTKVTVDDLNALLNYGFLPDLEDPPRLLLQDHHLFDVGLEENKVELTRLQKLAGSLSEDEAKGDLGLEENKVELASLQKLAVSIAEDEAIKGYEYRQEVDPYDEEDEYLDEEEEDGDEYRDEL
eukprot:gene387-1782_t